MSNTAVGRLALYNNFSGLNNTALGDSAGINVTTANDVICIGGNIGGENVDNTCYIGNIFGVTSAGAAAVYVNSLGKLGTVVSSRRFKERIKPMDKASEAILALKPVTFHYKKDIDPQSVPQFGLVAEDVEKVNPDLVVRDGEGKVNTVRYEAVNAMLLNEFLKEHRKVEKLEATVAQQQKEFQTFAAEQQSQIQALTACLEQQAAQIQKVSAQLATASPSGGGLEMSKPSPQVVLSNPVAKANR
jgi:Chaperone of endosialidase